jgi:translation initiation factor IF-3
MFRGREQSRPELGFRLLQRLAEDVQDLGFVESSPKQDGRNMIMVLGPHKKKTEAMAEAREAQAARKAAAQAGVTPRRQGGAEDAVEEATEAVEATEQQPEAAAAEAPAPAGTEAAAG